MSETPRVIVPSVTRTDHLHRSPPRHQRWSDGGRGTVDPRLPAPASSENDIPRVGRDTRRGLRTPRSGTPRARPPTSPTNGAPLPSFLRPSPSTLPRVHLLYLPLLPSLLLCPLPPPFPSLLFRSFLDLSLLLRPPPFPSFFLLRPSLSLLSLPSPPFLPPPLHHRTTGVCGSRKEVRERGSREGNVNGSTEGREGESFTRGRTPDPSWGGQDRRGGSRT